MRIMEKQFDRGILGVIETKKRGKDSVDRDFLADQSFLLILSFF